MYTIYFCFYRYQNYCAIDYSELLVPVPPGLGMDVAAVVTCGGITAYNAVGKLEESLKEALDVKGNFVITSEHIARDV